MKYNIKPFLLISLIFLTSFSFIKSKKIKIVFLGDSITQGCALPDPSTEATPFIVEQILKTKNQFSFVSIANRGFGGHTSLDFLPATNTDLPKVPDGANAFARDKDAILLFSILWGTNDSAISGPNGAPIPAGNYKSNLKAIIDSLLKLFPNAKFVLQYPHWYSPITHNNSTYLQEGLQRLESYFPQSDNLVKEYETTKPERVFAGDKQGFELFKKEYKKLLISGRGKEAFSIYISMQKVQES